MLCYFSCFNNTAAVWCSSAGPVLGGVGLGSGVTGKMGRARVVHGGCGGGVVGGGIIVCIQKNS